MSTRFVLALNERPNMAPRNEAIKKAIDEEGASWWHWYQYTWLIYDPRGRTSVWWRDRLKTLQPPLTFMIFNVDNGEWNGFTKKDHYKWMYEVWDKKTK